MSGSLAIVSTPIGNLDDLSVRAAAALCDADLVLAEDTRHTGRLLAHVGSRAPQLSLHEHNEDARIDEVLARIVDGARVALVSDAGTPTVSDPGMRLVRACVAAGVRVEPLPGASSLLAALVVSGLPTDRVSFDGFLPRRGGERTRRLAELADESRTIVLFLSPHRAAEDLTDLARELGGQREAALCRELTKLHEEVVHGDLARLAVRAGEGLRGELTLVVAGRDDEGEAAPGADDVARVTALVAEGSTTRDAVARVAAERGLGRRALYREVIATRPARRASPTDSAP